MGKRGTKKAPAALKIARGTHRKDRDGDPKLQPQPARADLSPPENLGDAGRAVWLKTSAILDRLGMITELDLAAFHTYCRAHDEIAKCDQVLAGGGETFMTDKGTICQHPMVNQRFKWLELARRYETEFGMTPSSRTGVEVNKPAEADAFSAFITKKA